MSAKSNGLLKVLLGVVGVLVVAVLGVAFSRNSGQAPQAEGEKEEVIYDISDAERKGLGLKGDTPHDTLKTLQISMGKIREEIKVANEENNHLRSEKARLEQTVQDMDKRLDSALSEQAKQLTTMFNAQMDELFARTQRSSQPEPQPVKDEPLPIGNGQSVVGGELGQSQPESQTDLKGMVWINPTDIRITDKNGKAVDNQQLHLMNPDDVKVSFPTPFRAEKNGTVKGGNSNTTTANQSETSSNTDLFGRRQANTVKPYYTLPDNSTLMGATALTALLGRVPIDGTVTDAYPFKVMIGRENLIANGIELPDVEGAIVSGTASGDWTLSCVRADVTSLTFVFRDGRISNGVSRTLGVGSDTSQRRKIGWLSNPEGLQCIPGERKTNAPAYLSTAFLLSGAGAAANSFAQGQTSAVIQDGSVVGAVTGNQGRFILGQAIAGGLKETEHWYRQRYGQQFDAIYVKPGQSVAVHITEQLNIDYDTGARKVKYPQQVRSGQLD